MPRHPKDPNNPVTRLREALSTPTLKLTRKVFCERYGFSLDSITALERGAYNLTRETAQRIASATGVNVGSLLMNRTPLRDWKDDPVSPKTKPPSIPASGENSSEMTFLLKIALAAAKESKSAHRNKDRSIEYRNKDRSTEFYILFKEWVSRTMEELGTQEAFWKGLFSARGRFTPSEATYYQYHPRGDRGDIHRYRQLWEKFAPKGRELAPDPARPRVGPNCGADRSVRATMRP